MQRIIKKEVKIYQHYPKLTKVYEIDDNTVQFREGSCFFDSISYVDYQRLNISKIRNENGRSYFNSYIKKIFLDQLNEGF